MMHKYVTRKGHEPLPPVTGRMLRYWWGRINREVFGGELHQCQLAFGAIPEEFGECMGLTYPLEAGLVRILLGPLNDTRKAFLATLAHEMVHQHQHQSGLKLDHGRTFTRWSKPIRRKTGLTI